MIDDAKANGAWVVNGSREIPIRLLDAPKLLSL